MIERHAGIIRQSLAGHDGIEVSTEGDSFFAVFTSATDAVAAATDVQQALAAEEWPEGGAVAVRIGLHTGNGELGHDNYVGIDVNRAARISAAGHGGQVVVSATVRALAADAAYVDLGEHSLKGLERTEQLFQLDVPGLPQTFPPLRTASNRPNNLPTLAARILGREEEIAEVQQLLDDHRLVTIIGPGGVGKTRLALEVATDVLTRFEQGAFLIDLAPIDDAPLVLPEIAATIGIGETAERDLTAALGDGARLLVLDNFEQVVDAAPAIANVMAQAAPVKALVTSQLPLRIGGERVYRLGPLPAAGTVSPAIELFAARAAQADPAFDLDAQRDDVARLVASLEGVPLAIELAAARTNVLTPGQVLERLETGLGVLKTSRPDAPDRHRSLEAAVAWSYGLLTEDQQALLHVLSVFRGGATMTALESVADRDVIDDLAELVDRSLAQTENATVGKRFRLLAPVQLFVEDLVADAESLVAQHTAYFSELAASAREPLEGDTRARWLATLRDDHDNLRATLDHMLDHGNVAGGQLLLGNIWRYFHSSGQLQELGLWLDRLFEADEGESPTYERARALLARAAFHYWRGEWPESVADYRAAIAIAEALDDLHLVGESLQGLVGAQGNALSNGLDLGDPAETAMRGHRVFTELGDEATVATIESSMEIMRSIWAPDLGKPSGEVIARALQVHEATGSLMNLAQGHITLAQMDAADGKFRNARESALTAMDIAERAGDVFTMGWALRWIAIAIVELGDPALGARLSGAAAAAEERLGGKFLDYPWYDGRAEDLARDRIGAEADEAFEEGREVGLIEAVRLARMDMTAT